MVSEDKDAGEYGYVLYRKRYVLLYSGFLFSFYNFALLVKFYYASTKRYVERHRL